MELRATDPSFGNSADDPYNVAYYKRDTGRRLTSDPAAMHRDIEQIKLELLPQDDPRVKEAMEEFEKGPGSSPGNKGVFATGKSDYDPSGLRATMSTNWEATEKSLDENMPDHVSFVLFVLSLLLLLKEDVAFLVQGMSCHSSLVSSLGKLQRINHIIHVTNSSQHPPGCRSKMKL